MISLQELRIGVVLVAVRLLLCLFYDFFHCSLSNDSNITTGIIITLDSGYVILHLLLWIVMGWAALFCITMIDLLSRHLPYYRKRVLCLILAAFPLYYQFIMIKFLHSYFASCFSGTIQVFGIFPATILVLQTCFQFAFIMKQFRLKHGHQNRESELRNAATYISQYNLFMLVHLACVEILSLRVDGWKTDILFLGVSELFTRIWGYYSFKNLSKSPLIMEEENLNRNDELIVPHRNYQNLCTNLCNTVMVVCCCRKFKEWFSYHPSTSTRIEQPFGHSTSEDSVGYVYSDYSIDNTKHHKYNSEIV